MANELQDEHFTGEKEVKEQKSQALTKVGECLYRNGIGTYFALVKVRGKQIKRSLKTNDPTLAKRRLADFRLRAERMHGSAMRDVRFEEFAEMWLESIEGELKSKSFDRRKVALVGLMPSFQGRMMRSIGHAEIEDWRRRRGTKISARSHNIELETLKLIFAHAKPRGIILDDPTEDFSRRKQNRPVVEMPSKAEFVSIVRELRASGWAVTSGAADFVEFLAYSGTRVGEAREVRFRDVSFERGKLLITGGEYGTKNHKQREIPLFPPVRELVLRMIAARGGEVSPDARLFLTSSPRGGLEAACKRAAVKRHSVHSLRHFFASNAIEAGVHFKVIAEWLGHSDGGSLVARVYGHLRDEFSDEMARRMSFQAVASEPQVLAFSGTEQIAAA